MINEHVWLQQEEFQRKLSRVLGARWDSDQAFVKDMVLNLMSELDELLRTMNWKVHRKIATDPNRSHTLEELIDIFKLWLTVVQRLGYTTDELLGAFERKSMVVERRLIEEWVKVDTHSRIVVLDLDHVLCNYADGFLEYAQTYLDRSTAAEIKTLVDTGQYIGWPNVSGSPEDWERVKHAYRIGGYKQALPAIGGAPEFTEWLKARQYMIVIVTSRPFDRYPNMHTDTIYWLTQHGIQWDFLLSGREKDDTVVYRGWRDRVTFAVEDDPRYVQQFRRIGIPVYWMVWYQQRHPDFPVRMMPPVDDQIVAVTSFDEIVVDLRRKESV